jgi:hypothetical protein
MNTRILILIAILILNGCSQKEIRDRNIKKTSSKVILEEEKFDDFYNRFYSDSTFQISRIVFPLPGDWSNIIYGDEVVEDQLNDTFLMKNNKLFWQKKGWRFLGTIHSNDKVLFKTFKKDGAVIREEIQSKKEGWVITNEFSLIDKKWMLIYHGDVWY